MDTSGSFQPISMKVERALKEDQVIRKPLKMTLFDGSELSKVETRIKRIRSANFSQVETDVLMKICIKYGHILQNKRTDKVTNLRKMTVWRAVALEFNSSIRSKPERDAKSLKFKYDQIKKDLRKNGKDVAAPPPKTSHDDYPASTGPSTYFDVKTFPPENERTKNASENKVSTSLNSMSRPSPSETGLSPVQGYQIELLQLQIERQKAENIRLQELHEAKKAILHWEMEKLKVELFLLTKNSH